MPIYRDTATTATTTAAPTYFTTAANPNWHIEAVTTNWNIDKFVKQSDIQQIVDELTRKIYNVLYDLNKIDISEDEFMKLIKEG